MLSVAFSSGWLDAALVGLLPLGALAWAVSASITVITVTVAVVLGQQQQRIVIDQTPVRVPANRQSMKTNLEQHLAHLAFSVACDLTSCTACTCHASQLYRHVKVYIHSASLALLICQPGWIFLP